MDMLVTVFLPNKGGNNMRKIVRIAFIVTIALAVLVAFPVKCY